MDRVDETLHLPGATMKSLGLAWGRVRQSEPERECRHEAPGEARPALSVPSRGLGGMLEPGVHKLSSVSAPRALRAGAHCQKICARETGRCPFLAEGCQARQASRPPDAAGAGAKMGYNEKGHQ